MIKCKLTTDSTGQDDTKIVYDSIDGKDKPFYNMDELNAWVKNNNYTMGENIFVFALEVYPDDTNLS